MISSKTTFVNDTNVVSVNTYKVNMNLTQPNVINMNLIKTDVSVRQNSIAKQGPRGADGTDGVDGAAIKLHTSTRLPILDNKIILVIPAVGDIVLNIALVYPNINSNIVTEYSCIINPTDSSEVLFDALDNLSGQYAIISYCIFS